MTGCGWIGGWGSVCSTIGYINEVRVLLTGDAESVTEVALCDDAGVCSVVESQRAEALYAPLRVIEPGTLGVEPIEPTEPIGPAPIEIPPYLARSDRHNEWAITVMAELPEDVTVTAYRSDESIAGVSTAVLDWVRVGGSERCGGPMKTGPMKTGPVTVAVN